MCYLVFSHLWSKVLEYLFCPTEKFQMLVFCSMFFHSPDSLKPIYSHKWKEGDIGKLGAY